MCRDGLDGVFGWVCTAEARGGLGPGLGKGQGEGLASGLVQFPLNGIAELPNRRVPVQADIKARFN